MINENRNNKTSKILTWIIIFKRSIYYFFLRKKSDSSDFITVNYDDTFSNSLIQIDFYFENLIYLSIPNLGRKLYNGTLTLNAFQGTFPLIITIKTAKGKSTYEITNRSHPLVFDTKKVVVDYFKSHKYNTLQPNRFNQDTLKNKLKILSRSKIYTRKTAKINHSTVQVKKEKLKINHTQFKTNHFL